MTFVSSARLTMYASNVKIVENYLTKLVIVAFYAMIVFANIAHKMENAKNALILDNYLMLMVQHAFSVIAHFVVHAHLLENANFVSSQISSQMNKVINVLHAQNLIVNTVQHPMFVQYA